MNEVDEFDKAQAREKKREKRLAQKLKEKALLDNEVIISSFCNLFVICKSK
jgi:hypothetical protein